MWFIPNQWPIPTRTSLLFCLFCLRSCETSVLCLCLPLPALQRSKISLGNKALSHDSVFVSDSSDAHEALGASQDSIHGKVKSLQVKTCWVLVGNNVQNKWVSGLREIVNPCDVQDAVVTPICLRRQEGEKRIWVQGLIRNNKQIKNRSLWVWTWERLVTQAALCCPEQYKSMKGVDRKTVVPAGLLFIMFTECDSPSGMWM